MATLTPGSEEFRKANQRIAELLGFSGSAGGGSVDAWLTQNPSKIQAYIDLRRSYLEPDYNPPASLQALKNSTSQVQSPPINAQTLQSVLAGTTAAPTASQQASTQPQQSSFAPINQQILNALGFTGTVGGGAGDAWLAQNPSLIPTYTAVRQAIEPNYVPPANLQQAAQPYINQIAPESGGVVPVGQIEPFNQMQKDALTKLGIDLSGQFKQYGDQYANMAQASFSKASPLIQQGTAQLTPNQLKSGVQGYLDPYMQQVLDYSIGQIRKEGDRSLNQVKSDFAKSGYGSSAMGTRQGLVDEAIINAISGTTANLSSQGYNNALDAFLSNRNQEQTRALQGAISNLAQAELGSNISNQQYGLRTGNLQTQLGAGTAIQEQNQKLLDILRPEIYGEQNYNNQQLQQLGSLLGLFQGNQNTVQQQPSTTSQVGGGLMALLGLGQSAAAPAGMVGPTTQSQSILRSLGF